MRGWAGIPRARQEREAQGPILGSDASLAVSNERAGDLKLRQMWAQCPECLWEGATHPTGTGL